MPDWRIAELRIGIPLVQLLMCRDTTRHDGWGRMWLLSLPLHHHFRPWVDRKLRRRRRQIRLDLLILKVFSALICRV